MAGIAVSLVEKVVKKVAKYVLAPVCRHCGYLIFSNRNVRQLKDELDKMDLKRKRVQHLIDEAQRNLKPIEPEVEKWMENVKNVTTQGGNVMKEAKTVNTKAADALLLDHDGRGNKTCFCKWFPNPKTRYRLGKKASRMIKHILELIGQGQFQKVHFENPPPGLVTGSVGVNSLPEDADDAVQEQIAQKVDYKNPPPVLVGGAPDVNSSSSAGHEIITDPRAFIFREVMKALEDETVKVVGIYGPGGVGKTTLLREVEKELRTKKILFEFIANSTVSNTPDLTKIQDNIAHYLGADLKAETGEEGRRHLLYKRLQNDKTLVILDDLWTEVDLRKIEIPWGGESSKCKLLVTSRFKEVLIQMKCAPSIFHLRGLEDDEALRLFEKTVGDRLKDDEEVRAIAPQVVKKLAGLPLLINSVATTLKNSNLSAWKYASKYIDVTKMETIVKLSYDHLRSEDAKTLFRVCGLIGGTIEVELLLGLGMGLGLFEEFNSTILECARDKLNTMLDSLRSSCLLEDGGDDDKGNVTIHDVYSEVVVSSTQLGAQDSLLMNSNYGSWPKKKLEKCWAIRLADAGRERLAKLMTYQFPELKLLMLSQHGGWGCGPEREDDEKDCCGPLDFKDMKELRVLYLCSMHIAPLTSSIEILVTLRSLYLEYCDVEDVAILGKLKTLEILSFAGSTIGKLPEEISGLTKLRSLNLSGCYCLKIIERGALQGLINLEELYMRGSFDQWMGEDKEPSESCNANSIAELKSLTKLTALEIFIRDPALLLEDGDLPFGNLIRFWINIGHVYGRKYESWGTTMLNLSGVDSILSKEWVQKTLQRTQYLCLEGLRESKESAHELCNGRYSQLKLLIINNSTSIKYIALSAFPSLESLHLENLDNLEKIYDATGEPECFGKLKYINVRTCDRLKNLWCLSNQQRLVHLEEIKVSRCESMQAIITYDARNVGVAAADVIVELPNVRYLFMRNLPSMRSFCIGDNGAPIQVSFPCLAILSMFRLSKLENLCHGPPESFSKLEVVSGESCPQLKTLLNVSSKRLVHLEQIDAAECDSMQAIITYDARNVEATPADVIVELPNVSKLFVHILPSMTSFCIGDNGAPIQVSFPRLESLSMSELSNLENLCHGPPESFSKLQEVSGSCCPQLKTLLNVSNKRLVHLKLIEVEGCKSMQAIITYETRNVEVAADIIVELPNLPKLYLDNLHSMTSFCIGDNGAPIQVSLPCLEELTLISVGSLQKIWYSELSESSFYKLAYLELNNCPDIVNVFPSTIFGGLPNLEEVTIVKCSSLESLIDCGSLNSNTKQVMSFPFLRSLRIEDCPNVVAFVRTPINAKRPLGEMVEENDESAQPFFNEMVTFPNITVLIIEGIRCEELWNNHIPHDSFCKLKSLSLEGCDKLRHIAPSCVWKRLQCCLEILRVISCPLIEVIYEGDGTDTESSKLRSLVMRDLDALKHIWRSDGQPNVPFPNLRKVGAVRCSRLEILFASFTEKFLGKMEELVVESCEDMKLIAGREEGERAISREITFLKLTALGLLELPRFRSFLPEKYSLNFPSLHLLNQKSCGNEPDENHGDWEYYKCSRTYTRYDEQEFLLWESEDEYEDKPEEDEDEDKDIEAEEDE